MKKLLRSLLRRFGYKLLNLSSDPVINELDRTRDILRMNPGNSTLWEHRLAQLALNSHLRDLIPQLEPDLVIDVGANRGQFADLMRELGYRGPILSLEPQSNLATELSIRSSVEDSAWSIVQGGAGKEDGELELNIFQDDSFSSFHEPNEKARDRFKDMVILERTEKIKVRRLDDWWRDSAYGSAQRILLKSDTQGHDLDVMKGASQILDRCCAVLCEASLIPIYDSSASPTDLADLLEPHQLRLAGYYAVSHDESDLAVIEVDALFTRKL